MTYSQPSLYPDHGVIRDSDGAYVPDDEGNVDWQEYLRWRAKGNTPTKWIPPEEGD